MDLEKIKNNSIVVKYKNTDNVLEDICSIIESARSYAYQSVNMALVERNWFIGYRIAEEELKGNNRADYGTDADVARYSVLHGNEQLFATKYKTYLPTEEQLKAEIETQKTIFELQQQESKLL